MSNNKRVTRNGKLPATGGRKADRSVAIRQTAALPNVISAATRGCSVTGKDILVKRFSIALLVVLSALPLAAAERRSQVAVPLATNAFPTVMPTYVAKAIADAAAQYGVDPNLVAAMAFQESRFNPTAVSRVGAQGVMQLKPRTARSLGVKDSFDARQNVFGGTKYLRQLLDRFKGDVDMALAAYNAGPERVQREGARATAEAVNYVAMVKSYYSAARRAL
jgi:soluble lytic murein transglycosylase-like protein